MGGPRLVGMTEKQKSARAYDSHLRRVRERGEPTLFFVYALRSPSSIGYIGMATSLAARMCLHRNSKTAARAVNAWMARASRVTLEVLHVADCPELTRSLELAEIARHLARGDDLVNRRDRVVGEVVPLGRRRALGRCALGDAANLERQLREHWKRRNGSMVMTMAGVERFVRNGESAEHTKMSGWVIRDWYGKRIAGPTTYEGARQAAREHADVCSIKFEVGTARNARKTWEGFKAS